MIRRFSAMLLATAMAVGPALSQVTTGDPTVGGVPSTAAPSASQGTPASASRHHRHRHRAHHRRHHTARPAATDTNSGAGLNGSDVPSR